ncbi:hypothetical protein KAH81_06855 [bacterium]|nr:hypothetical protein [bacterium]
MNRCAFVILFMLIVSAIIAQPVGIGDGEVKFILGSSGAKEVFITGGFNRWSPDSDPMVKSADGKWTIVLKLEPGIHQYKFVVDGNWMPDSKNSAYIDDNYGGLNSVFVLKENGDVALEAKAQGPVNPNDEYPEGPKIHLAIIWHQHQPLYADPSEDYLRGPWVRLHATKDYYDMAAMLEFYPDIHLTINLTSVLLKQLKEYYVDRLSQVVIGNKVDEKAYWEKFAGKTDPWIDLLLKDTDKFTPKDENYLTGGAWNCFSISEVMIERFPEYMALRDKGGNFSTMEKLQLKVWFALAWFDPGFLDSKIQLVSGEIIDLTDLLEKRGGKWFARRPFTEVDANRIVAESYKVMSSIIPQHKKLMAENRVEVITTPFFHPILPLLYDTDIAKKCQPGSPLPERYSYPDDAKLQVYKGVAYFWELFGHPPLGMWPGEGSVSEEVVSIFSSAGLLWTATADAVLQKSNPPNQPIYRPYRVDADLIQNTETDGQMLAVVFRDTELSDRIGFKYQTKPGEEAAEDFVQRVLSYAKEGEDRLITVILDGENAWEWYRLSPDGKDFLETLYRKLTKLHQLGRVITVTPGEYIIGNPERGIEAHDIGKMPELEPLWPGSWINANFDTWIGEKEENIAWNMLGKVRRDIADWGLTPPKINEIPKNEKEQAIFDMWDAMFAAEGSDWFWWYGADQGAPGGDMPFDEAFRTHLSNVYRYARKGGIDTDIPQFESILSGNLGGGGAMTKGGGQKISVTFVVDANHIDVSDKIYIVGEQPEFGEWTPNQIPMFDDGTHGDAKAGDGIWSLNFEFPEGAYLEYKYTNSGKEGEWIPGEEFPATNRAITVSPKDGKMTIKDKFGEM